MYIKFKIIFLIKNYNKNSEESEEDKEDENDNIENDDM